MKLIVLAALSSAVPSLTAPERRSPAPATPPPAGMSWDPAKVWKNVRPTTPADFWPPPPAEPADENARKKGGGKKGAAKKKQA